MQRLRARCREAVERVGDAVVTAFPAGTRLSRPAGGFVLWVELPDGGDAVALFRRARSGGIAFAPGPLFSATGGLRSCLRINCAREWTARTARAIGTLGRLAHG